MNNAFVSCFTTVLCYMGLIFSPLVLFPTPARAEMTPEEILRFQYDFAANIYQKYADSVVFVTGSFIDPQTKSLDEYFNNDKKKLDNSIGTGFFILPSGYVLTNAHGVHKSIDQIVETRDDKSYPAEVVGFILNQDIALLKVELPKPAVCVTLREKGQIQPGEPIVTIGHPHGLKYTCTQGIISAVGRRSLLSDIKVTLDDLLQSDAGINPGSSGGPWFDASCQAIGMTASRRAGSDNIAFGVSCSTILKLLPELFDFPRRNGYVLGFTVRWENENCVIDNLIPQSEAEKSGLKNGDILTSVNGKKISGMMGFISEEELFKPEQKIYNFINKIPEFFFCHFMPVQKNNKSSKPSHNYCACYSKRVHNYKYIRHNCHNKQYVYIELHGYYGIDKGKPSAYKDYMNIRVPYEIYNCTF